MPIVIAFQPVNLQSFLTFNAESVLSQINPSAIYIFGTIEGEEEIVRDFERVTNVKLIFKTIALNESIPHFASYLEAIHQIIISNQPDKFYIVVDNSPMEMLLAGYTLATFFDIRIVFEQYIIPSQSAMTIFEKKRKILQLIWENHPQSMSALINLMKGLPFWENCTLKNLRSKVSYDLGQLEKQGFLIYEVGTQGRIIPKFTKLGAELMKLSESKAEGKVD